MKARPAFVLRPHECGRLRSQELVSRNQSRVPSRRRRGLNRPRWRKARLTPVRSAQVVLGRSVRSTVRHPARVKAHETPSSSVELTQPMGAVGHRPLEPRLPSRSKPGARGRSKSPRANYPGALLSSMLREQPILEPRSDEATFDPRPARGQDEVGSPGGNAERRSFTEGC